jgi:NADPH:quinone reductase-like Zn-dependent oxidoreductase
MPGNLTFEQAAAVPLTGVTALQGLRRHGALEAGQQVLINGASGGVGTFAVQIARALGAEVTGVGSTRNLELMHTIGAHHVVDYTQEDFTAGRRQYDLIFDTVANHPAGRMRTVLTPTGRYVSTAVSMGVLWLGPWLRLTGRQRMRNMMARPNPEDLLFLARLLSEGKIVPVIDRCFPLEQAAEALRYLEQGHARGKIIVRVKS